MQKVKMASQTLRLYWESFVQPDIRNIKYNKIKS